VHRANEKLLQIGTVGDGVLERNEVWSGNRVVISSML
jgi:hypothetical protein